MGDAFCPDVEDVVHSALNVVEAVRRLEISNSHIAFLRGSEGLTSWDVPSNVSVIA